MLISLCVQPFDLALCRSQRRSLELDCTAMRYICVKSTGHFRSGFEAIAGSIHNVDTVSLLPQDWDKIGFTRVQPLYPLDMGAVFQPLVAEHARL